MGEKRTESTSNDDDNDDDDDDDNDEQLPFLTPVKVIAV